MERFAKHFAVLEGPDENHTLVCFSIDRARPDSYMSSLEKELKKAKYEGDVLLDLLATNGEGTRRFMRLNFDGNQLHWLKAKIAPLGTIDSDTVAFCQSFYAKRPAILKNSVLSPAAQFRLRLEASVTA